MDSSTSGSLFRPVNFLLLSLFLFLHNYLKSESGFSSFFSSSFLFHSPSFLLLLPTYHPPSEGETWAWHLWFTSWDPTIVVDYSTSSSVQILSSVGPVLQSSCPSAFSCFDACSPRRLLSQTSNPSSPTLSAGALVPCSELSTVRFPPCLGSSIERAPRKKSICLTRESYRPLRNWLFSAVAVTWEVSSLFVRRIVKSEPSQLSMPPILHLNCQLDPIGFNWGSNCMHDGCRSLYSQQGSTFELHTVCIERVVMRENAKVIIFLLYKPSSIVEAALLQL